MQFIIVKNRENILLGPVDWKPRFIQSEFDELYENEEISVQFTVPPVEQGYLYAGDNVEIFPITEINSPDIDPNFDQPIGPFYTYVQQTDESGNTINSWTSTATYEKTDRNVGEIKSTVKSVAASLRYNKENAGTTANVQGTTVTVDTSRDGRAIFVQAYTTMPDGDVIGWKFPEGWLNLTKEELGVCVNSGVVYVQTQFAWEQNIGNQVDTASTVEELKVIYNSMFPVVGE